MLNEKTHKGRDDGWIYVLRNPLFPQYIKLGFTRICVYKRSKIISCSSSVPIPYEIQWALKVKDVFNAEKKAHAILREYKFRNEFFEIPVFVAVKLMVENGIMDYETIHFTKHERIIMDDFNKLCRVNNAAILRLNKYI